MKLEAVETLEWGVGVLLHPNFLSETSKLPEGHVKLLTWIMVWLRRPAPESWCPQETSEIISSMNFWRWLSWLPSPFSTGDVHRTGSGDRAG